jgi:proteasome lid subunit RPN8/RPN11
VTIRRHVLESVVAHARDSAPRECCGILLTDGLRRSVVNLALSAQNAETTRSERRYVLGHAAHLAAVDMEAAGLARIVGYYHSHPRGDATPSPTDVERAAPDVTYLIVGLRNSRVAYAAWRLTRGRFVQQLMEVRE